MDEKKERSYAKESTKSTPSGIRFDLDKLAFIQKRENLPTKQKVVDFLLNDYWWKWKVPVATAKEAPPLALKLSTSVEVPKNLQPLISAVNNNISLPVLMAKYFEEKRECQGQEDYQTWLSKIENDDRLNKQARHILKTTNQ